MYNHRASPMSSQATEPLAVGQAIGPYRLQRLIGQGGMAAVYEALNEQIGKRVALKVLRSDLAAHPEMLARFLNEMRNQHFRREIADFGALGTPQEGQGRRR